MLSYPFPPIDCSGIVRFVGAIQKMDMPFALIHRSASDNVSVDLLFPRRSGPLEVGLDIESP